jgi:hypothetical protein
VLSGIVGTDDVSGIVEVIGVADISKALPGQYAEDLSGLAGNAKNNYVLASSGNDGQLTIQQPPAYSSFVAQTSSFGEQSAPSVSGTALPVPSANARTMAVQILNSAGIKYLTNPAITELLTDLLMQLPWQYLSQNGFQAELVQELQKDTALNKSITSGTLATEGLGLLAGHVIGVLHDQLIADNWPPVVVEELTLAATGAVNYDLALVEMGNPELAAAYAVTETTVGEVVNTAEVGISWNAQFNQNLLQVRQMLALSDALHTAAEKIKNEPGMEQEYQTLMKASVSESQNAAQLAANASGYQSSGSMLSAFWNSLW